MVTVTVTVTASASASVFATVDGKHQVAVLKKWWRMIMMRKWETNVGAVEGEFVSGYFVRQVNLLRYPTALSRPHKLTR